MSEAKVTCELGQRELVLETGRVAKQADGSVWVQMGGTVVIVAAVSSWEKSPPMGFLPLTTDYRERAYAAGKIPGGFFKREGKPYEHEILKSRLIDRPLRPMFPKDYNYETQVLAFVVSYDQENDPDILGIVGASAALTVSDIPFNGPFGAVRIGYIDGEYIINPMVGQRDSSMLDIVVAGTGEDIIMVEGFAREVPQEILLGAFEVAAPALRKQVEIQLQLREMAGKPKRSYEPIVFDEKILDAIRTLAYDRLNEIVRTPSKNERRSMRRQLIKSVAEKIDEAFPEADVNIEMVLEEIERECVRKMIIEEKRRTDGRSYDEVRPISIEVGVLPRAHGSALFTRGETQSLTAVTLGTKLDEQKIEDLEGESWKSFLLHYNFPPFSVGDTRPLRGPSRREIGHGHLAEMALSPVIPPEEVFPYTIRIVSDILESNGSSSMATVCAGSLALMDAGVPVKSAVAGIAMGLIKENDKYAILTDILGSEDHFGDMDFKIAGTRNGITAFQMDIKIPGIPLSVIEKAVTQANEARAFVLDKMAEVIDKPRVTLSPYAPRIKIIHIKPDKIGEVIGSGGKVIRGIQEKTSTTIAIEDDGTVFISARTAEDMNNALKMIEDIIEEPEIGGIYTGTVTRVTPFGAFVRIMHNVEGLLHISEIENRRINRVEDVLRVGDKVKVKVIDIDEQTGRIRLSRKALLKSKSSDGRRTSSRKSSKPQSNRPAPKPKNKEYGGS